MAKCSGLPKGYGSGGQGRATATKGLPYAMQNISVQLSIAVEEWLETLRASVWTVIVPGVIILVIITVMVTVAWRIKKRMYPPTAAELHRQALLLLQKQEQQSVTCKQDQQQQNQQVLDLLTKALQQDPTWLPARLSLIAFYLYRLSDGHSSMKALKELRDEHGDMAQVQTRGLTLDAQAMVAGQGHMVQGALQEDRYLRTIPPPIKSEKRFDSSRTDKVIDRSIKHKTH
jgi:hypothetical protein